MVNALQSLEQLAAKKSTEKVGNGCDGITKTLPPPPTVRVHAKSPPADASQPPVEVVKQTAAKRKTKAKTKDPKDDLDVSWSNFKGVMEAYDLTEEETTQVLLRVVGPDQTGSSFWTSYQARVKQELADEHDRVTASVKKHHETPVVEPPRKRLRQVEVEAEVPLQQILPDNQLGDPTICPENEATEIDMGEGEGEEEEGGMDDDPEIPVFASSGRGDDDQDSPTSGAVTETEKKVVVAEPQPNHPVEPIRVALVDPKEDPASEARETLEKALKATPTPVKTSTRMAQHNVKRADDDFEMHGSPGTQQSLQHLSLSFKSFFLVLHKIHDHPYVFWKTTLDDLNV